MAIVQDVFDIPDDIATGLATGLYRRIGSVVRYASGPNKGQIVKHLKPVDMKTAEGAMGVGGKALQFIKQHKKGTIIVFAGAAVIGTGAWIYNKAKSYEPKVVTEFRVALRVYIDAIREGNMDVDKIDRLMSSLEELKKRKDYDKISILLTTEELEVYEYTIKLADDNNVVLTTNELNTVAMKNAGTIINLQSCLKAQKKIFEKCA